MKMWKNKNKIISSCWFRSASFIFMSSNEIVQHATILLISHKQKHHSFVFFSKIYSRPFTTWSPQSIISHEQLCFLHSDKLSSMNWIIRKLLANTSLMINRLELIVWHPSLYIYIYTIYIWVCHSNLNKSLDCDSEFTTISSEFFLIHCYSTSN